MPAIIQKGLRSGNFNLIHQIWSTCGLSRSFSFCQIRAARRIPTEEELATMSPSLQWYYRQMADPVLRRKLSDRCLPNHYKYYAKIKQTGEYERHLERKRTKDKVRYADLGYRFAHHMFKWLRRLSVDARESFIWKTHRPMVYPERVRKTCSTCLSSYTHGTRVW
jgi:hypothetical protein